VTTGKSEGDFHMQSEKTQKKCGDQYLALMKKTMEVCRKFEQKFGKYVPEISYTPEEK
jgi:hypothetical protein